MHRWNAPPLGQGMVCRLLCRQATNWNSAGYLSIESSGRDLSESGINTYFVFKIMHLKYLQNASHLALISMPQVLRKMAPWTDCFVFLIWPDLFIYYFCLYHLFQQPLTSFYFRYSFQTPVHEILYENHGDHGGNFSHAWRDECGLHLESSITSRMRMHMYEFWQLHSGLVQCHWSIMLSNHPVTNMAILIFEVSMPLT